MSLAEHEEGFEVNLAAKASSMNKAICPHCGKAARTPKAALFDEVMMGRETCERCGQEFLIVDDVPMTQEQYREKLIPPQK